MLKHLYIQNLALIDRIEAGWHPGFNVITGETGAGKSILLNGLALVLGKRADSQLMRDKNAKLIVEARFEMDDPELKELFDEADLDFEPETIIRREITPSGKSRAFVNDTPVRLETLEQLGSRLVDIHSQNQNRLLGRKAFRMMLLDGLAGNEALLEQYRQVYRQWKQWQKELDEMRDQYRRLQAEADYRAYQLAELEALDWDLRLDEAEEQLKQMEQRGQLLETLAQIKQLFEAEPYGIQPQWAEARQLLERLTGANPDLEQVAGQWDILIEQLNDTLLTLDALADRYRWMDDSQIADLQSKISAYYTLMTKHRVATQDELKALMEQWQNSQEDLSRLEEAIREYERKIEEAYRQMEVLSDRLRQRRKEATGRLESYVNEHLQALGMEHSRLRVQWNDTGKWDEWGRDEPVFLLSSDKGKTFGLLHKQASGGEMSRLMLIFKMLIAAHKQWPTVIFDEIDAGVSGDVARKMARMIKDMSRHMQVIVITHLPQMAALADRHFKVYKTERDGQVVSDLTLLEPDERIREIAEMIEGKPPSDTALEHARHLLESNV